MKCQILLKNYLILFHLVYQIEIEKDLENQKKLNLRKI